jgi:Fe-S cluster assembly protein SufD
MNFSDLVAQQYSRVLAQVRPSAKPFHERAWAEYQRLGLPDGKTESWKYSSLRDIVKVPWSWSALNALPEGAVLLREKYKAQFDVLMIVNGQLRLEDSVLSEPMKSFIGPTEAAEKTLFEDGFVSLTAALSAGGLKLVIPKNTYVERPLLVLRVQSGASTNGSCVWQADYSQIYLEADSQFQLAELFYSEDSGGMGSHIVRGSVAAGAGLKWLRLQQEHNQASHFSDVQLSVKTGAELELTQFNTGARWSRTVLRADVDGAQGEARVQGVTFGRDQQHIDQRILINHSAPVTRSGQLFKGVLKDSARGVVNGKIYIERDAQKVVSSHYNHNLLLSRQAEVDSKPELEVYADDVKANHGATIGRLDEDKIFYLMTRAIPRSVAQQMLAKAFVGDVLMKISGKALRGLADDRLNLVLPEFLSEMEAP